MRRLEIDRLTEWNRTWALAAVFGLASIPWTYGFVAGLEIPLWPAFIASATYFAADGGVDGLVRGYTSNFTGIVYGAATLALVDVFFGGGVIALSVTVGAFMFLASLHAFVPLLSFTPGAFFGYATLFSVEAAGATALGITGLPGETLAAILSMFLGALIGLLTDRISTLVS
jgi:hypothetical protein